MQDGAGYIEGFRSFLLLPRLPLSIGLLACCKDDGATVTES